MANDSFKVKNSLNIQPIAGADPTAEGDVAYDSTTHTAKLYNGTSSSAIVTAAHTATLTNKTFDADGTGNSITNIENADIKAAAAIALNKLAATTADKALISDGSGFVSASSVSATTLGYLDATSSVQTQLDAKVPKTLTTTTGDMIYASSANTPARLAIGSANQVIKSVGGVPAWAAAPSGGVNYIAANPEAETDTTGWTTYADAAGTSPVDGTGGSPTFTWTRSTSSPLRGSASFLATKDAANRQGEGVAYAITLDSADQAKPICVSFDYAVASGTYADGDLTVYLYDVTNSLVIQPAPYRILSATAGLSQKWIGYFQTSASSTSYRLIIHTASTSASAYTVKFDNFNVGPTYQSYGAVATDWQSYTSTSGLTGGTTTAPGYWRRVGDTLEVQIDYVGTSIFTGGTASFTLPTGLTIDTAKIPGTAGAAVQKIGDGILYDVGTELYNAGVYYNTTTTVVMRSIGDDVGSGSGFTNSVAISTTSPFTWANADRMMCRFSVPITGWSSNVQVSSDADTRVCAVSGLFQTPTGTIGNAYNVVKFGTVTDSHGAYNTTTGLYTVPVPGWYDVTATIEIADTFAAADYISVEVGKNGGGGVNGVYGATKAYGTAGFLSSTVSGVIYCNAGDTLGVYSLNSNGAATGFGVSGSGSSFSFARRSGPAQIAASETVAARYTTTGTTSIGTSDTLINFDTKDYDTHSAVTTGGSWKFTAPMAGKYRVTASMLVTTARSELYINLYKNGVGHQYIGFSISTGTDRARQGSGTINLVAGDYLTIYEAVSTGASSMTSNATANWVAIERVGN